MTKKKLQVFISSTYTDLLEERQSSVEAVLRPAISQQEWNYFQQVIRAN